MNFSAQGMLEIKDSNGMPLNIDSNGMPKFEVTAFAAGLKITMSTKVKSSGIVLSDSEIAKYTQTIKLRIIFQFHTNKLSACKNKASDIRVEDFKQEITEITLSGRSKEDHGVTRG